MPTPDTKMMDLQMAFKQLCLRLRPYLKDDADLLIHAVDGDKMAKIMLMEGATKHLQISKEQAEKAERRVH